VAQQVACAWYVVGYHLGQADGGPGAGAGTDAARESELCSFAWVAWPELVAVLASGSGRDTAVPAAVVVPDTTHSSKICDFCGALVPLGGPHGSFLVVSACAAHTSHTTPWQVTTASQPRSQLRV
jgi:hypothetical protein